MREQGARESRLLTRREAVGLGLSAAGVIALAACGGSREEPAGGPGEFDLVLEPRSATIELGSRRAPTWIFNGSVPGPELRVKQGARVRVRVDNALTEETTIHWHGIRLANAMDGVPGMTQEAIAPGRSFVYEFVPPDPGTFMFHPHVGTQLDRGLYGALIVEPRRETLDYDRDETLFLDDWVDGVDGTPDDQLERLRSEGMSMGGARRRGRTRRRRDGFDADAGRPHGGRRKAHHAGRHAAGRGASGGTREPTRDR